jgi:hypothetical protein
MGWRKRIKEWKFHARSDMCRHIPVVLFLKFGRSQTSVRCIRQSGAYQAVGVMRYKYLDAVRRPSPYLKLLPILHIPQHNLQ